MGALEGEWLDPGIFCQNDPGVTAPEEGQDRR